QPQPQPDDNSNKIETGAVLANTRKDNRFSEELKKLNGYNTNVITVDGVDIIIGLPGANVEGWMTTSVKEKGIQFEVCCGRYSDTRFGVNYSLDGYNSYLFYNGNPTQNMPTSGTATYSGDAIIAAADVRGLDQLPYYQGKSNFNVDFGNKTLKGTLDIPTDNNASSVTVGINAQIKGNTFAGNTESATLPDGKVEGKFYGDNAKEMAGLAQVKDKNSSPWSAAFGAAKQ
ncbi:hypothetical protein BKG94_09765, partial [Rodentibacter ratti]|uniref:Slam-dependent surface lipoprotein n=1 Tax=Rodentibacter ratti TaxID=1906745 RepID=UPI0009875E6A